MPGDPHKSRLVDAVGYQDPDLQMPPKTRLSADKVAVLTRWVELGAPWPETSVLADNGHSADSLSPKKKFDLAERRAAHWAWKPIRVVVAPAAVKHSDWAKDPLDNYLVARWEAAGLEPPVAADRRTLIRRTSFDLIGLPPTSDEVEAFVADRSPQSWEKVVDRLLASPQYGERWARHWLDLVRYAETRAATNTITTFPTRGSIATTSFAFNTDVPYNQFVMEQIAGDILPVPRFDATGQINESVLGTGFWHLGEWLHSPVDIKQDEMDRVDNQIDVMSKTFLGLTLGCARCHDHKFDAISAKDYYAIAGMLEGSSFRDAHFERQRENQAVLARVQAIDDDARKQILHAIVEDARPTFSHFADYLLGAREVLRAEATDAKTHDVKQIAQQAATVADRRHLDAARLARCVEMIRQAHKNEFNPLYPWALLSLDSQPESAERTAALLRPIATEWQAESIRAAALPPGAKWVVDYNHAGRDDWFTDGLAFGDSPARAGQIVLASQASGLEPPARPFAAVVSHGMANSGLMSPSLPGMLRTPEFKIIAPQVWFRVRGSGDLFVVVDSHRMVAGPLHGGTKRHLDVGRDWTWVSHNLNDYVGERAHIEFTPSGRRRIHRRRAERRSNRSALRPSQAEPTHG